MTQTIKHPLTGDEVTLSGYPGTVYPARSKKFTTPFMIRVSRANYWADLADSGKFIIAVDGRMYLGPYDKDEAFKIAELHREEGWKDTVEVLEIVENWGTKAVDYAY